MAESDKPVRAHVVVHGRVQGVWFRGRTRNEALRQSLTGWVRNRPDGTVEAVFEGDRSRVQQMVVWCHQGPPLAHVTRVDLHWGEPTGEFSDFRVDY
ncbi:MAG: acylphosphatase [Candidatus Brocadiaceae bacterium]|nr:acylphosphatase [Candidatus Brocadiaceae bacterium]